MKNQVAVAFAAFGVAGAAIAGPVTLTFDDAGFVDFDLVGAYGGLVFDSVQAHSNALYNSSYGNSVVFPSASMAIYNSGGVVSVSASGGSDFSLIGAKVSTFAANNSLLGFSSTSITIEGWDDGIMVGTTTLALGVVFADIVLGFNSIDEIRFINDGVNGRWWLLDNLVVDFGDNPIIPLPTGAAMALVGLGLVSLRRRRG